MPSISNESAAQGTAETESGPPRYRVSSQPRQSFFEQDQDNISISVADVSVRYRMPTERVTTLKEQVVRRLTRRSTQYNEFWALRHVNLQIRKGEAVALIGRNGAGKSTLLKVIAHVQQPSSGRIWVRGAISPLIELGAGFHPELTGIENVFLNGAMLGYSRKQMEEKLEGIIAFSELETFMNSPLRTYSSGMQARLGFAVATAADPDILIVDEVLSVGDEAFQQKCLNRMQEYRARGTTILYVTHGLDSVKTLCSKAALVDEGRVIYFGEVDKAVQIYRQFQEDSNLRISSQRQVAMVVKAKR